MTDRENAQLRGQVRKYVLKQEHRYPGGHRVDSTFSPEGHLLEKRQRNADGSEWSVICRYDDSGRIVERQQHGKPSELISYRYDSLGRLLSVTARSAYGDEHVRESYQYDAAGRKTRIVHPPPIPAGANVGIAIDCMFEFSPEASSIVTLFDEQDRPSMRIFYDPNNNADRVVLLRHDAHGRLVEEGEREPDGTIARDRNRIYIYDDNGQPIEITTHHSLGTFRKTFAYNEHGDLSRERQEHRLIVDDTEDWTSHYLYQYDDRGNWTERTTEVETSDGARRVNLIERRQLDYY